MPTEHITQILHKTVTEADADAVALEPNTAAPSVASFRFNPPPSSAHVPAHRPRQVSFHVQLYPEVSNMQVLEEDGWPCLEAPSSSWLSEHPFVHSDIPSSGQFHVALCSA